MKICFGSDHRFPGKLHGNAPHMVHDNLVKGLAELGHEVYYCLNEAPEVPIAEGVQYVPKYNYDVDLLHINHIKKGYITEEPENRGMPWIRIIHIDIRFYHVSLSIARRNWVYVSQSLARTHNSERFVYNGIDPADFIYSGTKGDYLLFVILGVHRAEDKGFEIALKVSRETGIPLWVAGGHHDEGVREAFFAYCRREGAVPLGHVTGKRKAELFAGAKALIFPSKLNEGCGLVAMEALMSGTPVIGSNNGAIPELLDASTGFVCQTMPDYIQAVENCGKIKPEDCRKAALDRFHYLKMAEGYVREYHRELEHHNSLATLTV
jgi:glycosyltransferase involved in cell wall biosynthesis